MTTPLERRRYYARYTALREMPDLIYNMAAAEGNPIHSGSILGLIEDPTFKTNHDGADRDQVVRLIDAWAHLLNESSSDRFNLSKRTAIRLNELVATDEGRKVGAFRDDQLWVAGSVYVPPDHSLLDLKFNEMVGEVNQKDTLLDRAVTCFALCAQNLFFFDGNKRTGQMLMNGILLSEGQNVITVPAKDVNEYHRTLLDFYESGDSEHLTQFLKDRQLGGQEREVWPERDFGRD